MLASASGVASETVAQAISALEREAKSPLAGVKVAVNALGGVTAVSEAAVSEATVSEAAVSEATPGGLEGDV